jgi:hypothetical protein
MVFCGKKTTILRQQTVHHGQCARQTLLLCPKKFIIIVGNMEVRDYSRDPGVEERIILKMFVYHIIIS